MANLIKVEVKNNLNESGKSWLTEAGENKVRNT